MGYMDDGSYEIDRAWECTDESDDEASVSRALRWFKKAAAKGNSVAMACIGDIYYGRKDGKNAYFWYLEAALGGNVAGMFNLAYFYHTGFYVKQDHAKALGYFHDLYLCGVEDPEFFAGYDWLFTECCFNLGVCYEYGYGCDVSYEDAEFFYYEGYCNSDGFCATNLGRLYALGLGREKDFEKAFYYYCKGAELGDPTGYLDVGYCYEAGQGVEKDIAMAKDYYSEGAERGSEKAAELLANLENGISNVSDSE